MYIKAGAHRFPVFYGQNANGYRPPTLFVFFFSFPVTHKSVTRVPIATAQFTHLLLFLKYIRESEYSPACARACPCMCACVIVIENSTHSYGTTSVYNDFNVYVTVLRDRVPPPARTLLQIVVHIQFDSGLSIERGCSRMKERGSLKKKKNRQIFNEYNDNNAQRQLIRNRSC